MTYSLRIKRDPKNPNNDKIVTQAISAEELLTLVRCGYFPTLNPINYYLQPREKEEL